MEAFNTETSIIINSMRRDRAFSFMTDYCGLNVFVYYYERSETLFLVIQSYKAPGIKRWGKRIKFDEKPTDEDLAHALKRMSEWVDKNHEKIKNKYKEKIEEKEKKLETLNSIKKMFENTVVPTHWDGRNLMIKVGSDKPELMEALRKILVK